MLDEIKEELEVEGHIGCVLDVASADEAQKVFCHSSLLQLADVGTCIFFMSSWASAFSSRAIWMLATMCCHENCAICLHTCLVVEEEKQSKSQPTEGEENFFSRDLSVGWESLIEFWAASHMGFSVFPHQL